MILPSANDITSVPIGKLQKCLSLAKCIVSVSKNKFTSFHLGLALQVHHIYGYKNLIEILHSHGLCASYHEIRHYLTGVADHEIKKIEHGSYLPHGIISPMVRPTLSRREQIMLTLTQKPLMKKTMARAVLQV